MHETILGVFFSSSKYLYKDESEFIEILEQRDIYLKIKYIKQLFKVARVLRAITLFIKNNPTIHLKITHKLNHKQVVNLNFFLSQVYKRIIYHFNKKKIINCTGNKFLTKLYENCYSVYKDIMRGSFFQLTTKVRLG